MSNHKELDNLIHSPKRLHLLAILAGVDRASFAMLSEKLELSQADLSRQVRILNEVGILKIHKALKNPQQGTWVSMTKSGEERYRNHVRILRSLTTQQHE